MGIFSIFKKEKYNELDEELEIKEIDFNEKNQKNKEKNFSYDFKVEENKEDELSSKNNASKDNLSQEEVEKLIVDGIISVIDNHKDFETIQATAKEVASIIGAENLDLLKEYIAGKISKPSIMKGRYEGLGDWPMVVENSVLTIMYSFEEKGVDELLKISVTNTTTRFKAINLLCKLAARGIEREKIVDSIIYIMKPLSEEEILKILGFLSQIKNHSKIDKVLGLYYKKFLVENKLENGYDTLLNIVNNKGKITVEQLTFLKALALRDGKLDISLIIDNEVGIIDLKSVSQELKVKSAISFYSINNSDQEINNKLLYLKENSLDKELRGYLKNILAVE